MNPGSAIDLMWRDVVELSNNGLAGQLALSLFVLLPVAAIVLVVRGHRGAWISLAITGGLCLGWLLYLGWQVAAHRQADAG